MINAKEAKSKTLSKERVEALEAAAFENYWLKISKNIEANINEACNKGLNKTEYFGLDYVHLVEKKLRQLGYKITPFGDNFTDLEIKW